MGGDRTGRQKKRRGAVEHFYRGVERPAISDEELALLAPSERQAIAREALQLLMADAGTSMAANTFGARPDHYIVRIPGYVDEEGWQELGSIYDDAMERIFDVLTICAKRRIANPAATSIPFRAGLTFFEMPNYEPPPSPLES